jgi:hypothetical protein
VGQGKALWKNNEMYVKREKIAASGSAYSELVITL